MSPTEAWFRTTSDSAVTVRFTDDEATAPRFSIGYWSIRGLGAPLRMMLCAARVDFVCYMYDVLEDGDGGWKKAYIAEKEHNLLQYTPFMNLPYIADEREKVVLTQTNACFQYLGNEFGMMGKTSLEHALCAQMLCEVYDLRDVMSNYVYGGKPELAKETVQAAYKYFAKFENHLRPKDKACYTVGDSLTAPDFHLFEMVDQYDSFCKAHGFEDCLADHPHVRAFYKEFAILEYDSNALAFKLKNPLVNADQLTSALFSHQFCCCLVSTGRTNFT